MTEEIVDDCLPAICEVEQCIKSLISDHTGNQINVCSKNGITIDVFINNGEVSGKGRIGKCTSVDLTAVLIVVICDERCSDDGCSTAILSREIRHLLTGPNNTCCLKSIKYWKFERIPANKGEEDVWTDYYTLSFSEN